MVTEEGGWRGGRADLNGERNNLKTNNSASFKLLWILRIADDDPDVVVKVTALLGATLSSEPDGISTGDKSKLIVSDCHREPIEEPMDAIFLVDHLLEDLHVGLLIFLATQHHTDLILLHSQLPYHASDQPQSGRGEERRESGGAWLTM